MLDGAIHRVKELGIKVDALLGDFDRNEIDFEEIKREQHPIQVVHTPNQDKTDLEKAFDFLIEKGHKSVNIVWATGRRADHSITNMTNMVRYRHKLKMVMYDDYSKIFPLPNHYEKWYIKGSSLSLIPVGEVNGIFTSGLMYNLSNESLVLGYRSGNSNEAAADGFVSINYQTGDLLLMECWD